MFGNRLQITLRVWENLRLLFFSCLSCFNKQVLIVITLCNMWICSLVPIKFYKSGQLHNMVLLKFFTE